MIPTELRFRLVEIIQGLAVAETADGRGQLLADIPNAFAFSRIKDNKNADINGLVLQLQWTFGPYGEWRLLQLVDNAARSIPRSELYDHLQNVRREITTYAQRPRAGIAEAGQVHLFDLRRLVMMCVAVLPPDGGLCGYVIPGASTRLLKYFCDNLKFRGAQEKVWTREQVATAAPLTVAQPHTGVGKALEEARKKKGLLAVKHVIWPAFFRDAALGCQLWLDLQAAFADRQPGRMIVVFGLEEGPAAGIPPGMYPLPGAQFTQTEIRDWWADLFGGVADPRIVERWTSLVSMGYESSASLPVDIVYDRLERYHQIVNECQCDSQKMLGTLSELESTGG